MLAEASAGKAHRCTPCTRAPPAALKPSRARALSPSPDPDTARYSRYTVNRPGSGYALFNHSCAGFDPPQKRIRHTLQACNLPQLLSRCAASRALAGSQAQRGDPGGQTQATLLAGAR
eukprot:2384223-Prymnesium_polylepis.1